MRLIAIEQNIPVLTIKKNQSAYSGSEYAIKTRFAMSYEQPLRMSRLKKLVNHMMEKYGTKVCIIDYLQQLRLDFKCNNEFEEINLISKELKDLATKTGHEILIICCVILNRKPANSGSNNKSNKPKLRDILLTRLLR